MAALTYREALKSTRPKWIAVGGRMIGLRPFALYSLSELFHQAHLLREYGLPEPERPWYEAALVSFFIADRPTIRRRLLPRIAETCVIHEERPLEHLRLSAYAKIVRIGTQYVTETAPSGKSGDEGMDIGAMVGSLQKQYSGMDFWEMPQYKLTAAAKALDPKNQVQEQATDFEFAMAMREIGVEVH